MMLIMTIAEISTSWHLLPYRNEQTSVYDKMRNCMSPMRQNEETPAAELRQNVGTVFNYDILRNPYYGREGKENKR